MQLNSDVLIIGAGPGGSACSLMLSKLGVDHVMVDKAQFPRDKVCGDALSGKVVEVLKKIDPNIINELKLVPNKVGSWGVNFIAPNGKNLRIPFKKNYDATSDSPPGYICKRIDFDHFLLKQAKKKESLKLFEGYELNQFNKTESGWDVSDKTNQLQISCKTIIAADGAHSKFAKQIGKLVKEPKHYCAGVRAYYNNVEGLDKDNFIELHFIKDLLPGYFWIFPLPNGSANVGLGIRSDKVGKEKLNLKKLLTDIIENHPTISKRFKTAEATSNIAGYGLPLGSKKRKLSGGNYLLVGDAASLIDPFTGEGIGNAMMSGMLAALHSADSIVENNFGEQFNTTYDKQVYSRLWSELNLSRRMQQLVTYPWLFNFVVNRATKSPTLQELISCMFEDLEIRKQLKKPSFYLNLLLSK